MWANMAALRSLKVECDTFSADDKEVYHPDKRSETKSSEDLQSSLYSILNSVKPLHHLKRICLYGEGMTEAHLLSLVTFAPNLADLTLYMESSDIPASTISTAIKGWATSLKRFHNSEVPYVVKGEIDHDLHAALASCDSLATLGCRFEAIRVSALSQGFASLQELSLYEVPYSAALPLAKIVEERSGLISLYVEFKYWDRIRTDGARSEGRGIGNGED